MAKYMEQKPHNYGNPIHDIYWIAGIIVVGIIVFILWYSSGVDVKTPEQCRAEALKCFELINQDRISVGREPLTWDNDIEQRALSWSQYMLDNDYYQHSDGNGEYAECLMVGSDAEFIFKGWQDSPLHYSVILNSNIRTGAIGIVSRTNKFLFLNFSDGAYATFQGY